MLIYEKIVDGIFLIYSDAKFWFKCNGIVIKNKDSGNVLIDCNCYYKEEIEDLLKDKTQAHYISHMHLDHTYNLHYYEELIANIKIYCPIPEAEYLRDFDRFIRENGTLEYGLEDYFKNFGYNELGFKEIKSVIGFTPGEEFQFDNIKLKTIFTPGHSPAHTAFSIEDTSDKEKRKILFVADIGLTKMGAWYGFKYSDLKTFRESIKRIEKVYLEDDYIITSGHGPIIFDKQTDIFNNLLIKLDKTEEKLLNMLDPVKSTGLEDLLFKGLIFPPEVANYMKDNPNEMVPFFENNMVLSLIKELLDQGKIAEVGNKQWILNE